MADGLLREDGGKLLTEDGGSILLAPTVVAPPSQHSVKTVPRRIPKVQFRRGTTAEWAVANPVLAAGEPGVDLDTGDLKIGNGTTAWSALPLPYAPPSFQASTPRGVVAISFAFDPVAHPESTVVDLTGSLLYTFDPTRRYRVNYTIRALSGSAGGKVGGTVQFWLWDLITNTQIGVDQIVAADASFYNGACCTWLFTASGLVDLRVRTSTYGNVMTVYGRDYFLEDIGAI